MGIPQRYLCAGERAADVLTAIGPIDSPCGHGIGQRGAVGPPSLVGYGHGGGDAAVDVEDGAGDVASFV